FRAAPGNGSPASTRTREIAAGTRWRNLPSRRRRRERRRAACACPRASDRGELENSMSPRAGRRLSVAPEEMCDLLRGAESGQHRAVHRGVVVWGCRVLAREGDPPGGHSAELDPIPRAVVEDGVAPARERI